VTVSLPSSLSRQGYLPMQVGSLLGKYMEYGALLIAHEFDLA
jgi:hypothetical protein